MQKTFIFLILTTALSSLSFCANLSPLQEDESEEARELKNLFGNPPAYDERTLSRSASTEPQRGSELARVRMPQKTHSGSLIELKAQHVDRQELLNKKAAATAKTCAQIAHISSLLNNDPEFDGLVFITREIKQQDGSMRAVVQNKTVELTSILQGNISHANQKNRDEALVILKAALEQRNTRYMSDLQELIEKHTSGTITCFSQDEIQKLQQDLQTIDAASLSSKLQELHTHFNTTYVRTIKTSPQKRSSSTSLSTLSPTNSSGRSSAVTRSNSVLQFASPELLEKEHIIPITPLADLENSTSSGCLFANPHLQAKAFEYFSSLNPEIDRDLHKVKTALITDLTKNQKIDVLEAVLAKKDFNNEFTSLKNKIERQIEQSNQKTIDVVKTMLFNCGTKFKRSSL